mgnify:CR=1 FL=1
MLVHVTQLTSCSKVYRLDRQFWWERFWIRAAREIGEDTDTILLLRGYRRVPSGYEFITDSFLYARLGLVWLTALALWTRRLWYGSARTAWRAGCCRSGKVSAAPRSGQRISTMES